MQAKLACVDGRYTSRNGRARRTIAEARPRLRGWGSGPSKTSNSRDLVRSYLSALLPVRQVAGARLAGQRVADHASGNQAGDLGRIVGRRALRDLHPGDGLAVSDDLKK